MSWLYENPLGIAIAGLIISALIAYAGLHQGETKPLFAAVGLLILTGLLSGLSVWVETDKEQIQRTIYEVAAALRNNDHSLAISYIHPNSAEGIKQATSELPRYTFHDAKVTSLRKVEVNLYTRPPTALSEMLVAVEISSQRPDMFGGKADVRRLVKIYWMRKADRWLIRDYEHSDFMDAFTNSPAPRLKGF